MRAEEFRERVKSLLGVEIKFAGHVDLVIENISEERQEAILKWIERCKLGTERPEPCKNFRNLLSFIYKSSDNKIRGILTKEKNAYFIELFLDKHRYYDQKRKYLGM